MRRVVARLRVGMCLLSVAIALASSGCIQVSPSAEILDCAMAFAEATSSRDLSAMTDLTVNRPADWETVMANAEFAWHDLSVVGIERIGDRAQVSIELEPLAHEVDAFDEPDDQSQLPASERLTWVIELQRVEGQWLVDLGRTLAAE